MKRLVRTSALLLLSFIAFSPPAWGQKTYALGVGGGGAIPVGKLSDTQSTGYNGLVVLAIGVADLPIGVRFDGVYSKFVYRTAPVGSPSPSDLRVAAADVLDKLMPAMHAELVVGLDRLVALRAGRPPGSPRRARG